MIRVRPLPMILSLAVFAAMTGLAPEFDALEAMIDGKAERVINGNRFLTKMSSSS